MRTRTANRKRWKGDWREVCDRLDQPEPEPVLDIRQEIAAAFARELDRWEPAFDEHGTIVMVRLEL